MTTVVFLFSLGMPSQAFTLSPGIIDIVANPGESPTGNLVITNDEDVERAFYLSIQKFVANGDQGQQTFLPLSDTEGLPDWIYFRSASFHLAAHASQTVPFIINIPKNATPGEYRVALFFSNTLPTQTGKSSVSFGAKTGSLLFLTVKGDVRAQLEVSGFHATSAYYQSLPVGFELRLTNTGNISVLPKGYVRITNSFGNMVGRVAINPDGGRILPDSSRTFDLIWGEKMAVSSRDNFFQRVREEWRGFAIGPYTARVELEGNVTSTGSGVVHFMVLPIELLASVGGALIVLVLSAGWVVSRQTRKKGKPEQKTA